MQSLSTKQRKGFAKHQKNWFGKWHTYAGVIAGSILVIVCLTGTLLVFEQELDVWLYPDLFEYEKGEQELTFQQLADRIEEQQPNWQLAGLFKDDLRKGVILAILIDSEEQVFASPYTGEILGTRVYRKSVMGFTRHLHRTLLVPVVGRYIVGICALFMVILVITGLRLWIPSKWKHLKSNLTIKRGASLKRQNYDFHQAVGFYFSPFLALISLTGVAITFSPLVILALFLVSFEPPQSLDSILNQQSTYEEGFKPINIDEAYAFAMEEEPEARISGISLPRDSAGIYTINLYKDNAAQTGDRTLLFMDQYTGEVLTNSGTDFPNIGKAYVNWVTPIHFGTFGGLTTRILALISSFMGAIMFLTGIIIWWPRYKKMKKNKPYLAKEKPLEETEKEKTTTV
ncbi:MAG: PepSY-associated TM helix domain-containing protein [Bacteroidota bacterium]